MSDILMPVSTNPISWIAQNQIRDLHFGEEGISSVDVVAPAQSRGFEDRLLKEASLWSSAIRHYLVRPLENMPDKLSMFSAWAQGAITDKVVFSRNQCRLC
ncbi:actin [Forsythia ovata]|uniref:Actin n=1 Tax=Forsythia ovata TaxID=205694 RepID=A0ABD1X517_9LAMI